MPSLWRRVRERASDLARRVRSRVTRSVASSLAGAGGRLSAVGNNLLDTLPRSPSMGQRHGPVRGSRDRSRQGEQVSSGSEGSLHRFEGPRGGFNRSITTDPNRAWGSRPAARTPFQVYEDTPGSQRGRSVSRRSSGRSSRRSSHRSANRRRLRPGQDGHPRGGWTSVTVCSNPVSHGLSQYAESSVLSQFVSAEESASWYNSTQIDQCAQGIDRGSDEESSSSDGQDYENVVSGIQCRYCGARLILTLLSLRDSISRYADYFVER